MKTCCKVIALLIVLQVLGPGGPGHKAAYADHQKPVLATVNEARRLGVPEGSINHLLAYALDNQLGADHTVHMLTILIRVRESQFPLGPFLNKIQEGLAKQIDPQRLEAGLNQRLDDYRFVNRLLNTKYAGSRRWAAADQTALVDSLGFGLKRRQLRRLFERAPAVPPAMLAIAAKNKALLKQITFKDEIADEIVFTGLTNKSLTSQWSLFFKVAAAARRKGISEAQIAAAAKTALRQQGDLQQVLVALEFTSRDVRHGPHLDSPPGADE